MLYVGKAASLRKRVASYFASVNRDRKSEELVSRAASIEPIVVASASEALLLEQQLIKRHRPPLNARLRDDKSYPYIAVTLADEYPRVLFTRERHRTGRPLLRPVRVGAEGAHDARDAQQDLPVPPLRGAGAGPALGRALPRLPHRPLRSPVRRADHARGLPGRDRRRDRLPRGPHEQDRARPRAAHAGGLGATSVRGGRAHPQPAHRRPAPQRAAGRGRRLGHLRRGRARRRGRHRQRAAARRARAGASRSAARTTSRTPRSRARTRCSRASCSSTTTRRSAFRRSCACTPRSPTPT